MRDGRRLAATLFTRVLNFLHLQRGKRSTISSDFEIVKQTVEVVWKHNEAGCPWNPGGSIGGPGGANMTISLPTPIFKHVVLMLFQHVFDKLNFSIFFDFVLF